MSDLPLIAQRVLNQPLLITPEKAQVILSVLAGRIGVDAPDASRFEGSDIARSELGRPIGRKPYSVKDGVAIITITGSLVNRGAWIGTHSGLTSYEGIQHQIKAATTDADVHSVILDLHSPGGEAVGAFETAALVRELTAKKRTVAIVNGMACSAGYAIASGATEIVTTETGVSGSIGVVMLHADISRQLDRDGITPTLIHAGTHKVDGNPFEPLSDASRSTLQGEVDTYYQTLLRAVGAGRGNRLTAEMARKTEARTYIGKAAIAAGVADRLGTFESVLAELTRDGGRAPARSSGSYAAQSSTSPRLSVADKNATQAEARAEGMKAGAAAERERFKAVMASEHYVGREAAAHHMLFTADMAAETIVGVLAGLPLPDFRFAEMKTPLFHFH